MTTVTLTNADRATEAGKWCVENLGYKYWNLDVANACTTNPTYQFQFKKNQDAVLFSLRWL